MNTPFGPAINLGTLDNPNYAGAAGGVAYLRGIHTALQVLRDLDPYSRHADCVAAVEGLLMGSPPPVAPEGATPTPPVIHVAVGNNPEKRDRA